MLPLIYYILFLPQLQCKICDVTHHQGPCSALEIARVPEAALCPFCLMARSSPISQGCEFEGLVL